MDDFPWHWYCLQLIISLLTIAYGIHCGWRQHWGILFVSGVYFLYHFLVPVSDFLLGVRTYFGYPLNFNRELVSEIGMVYAFGIGSLFMGYVLTGKVLRQVIPSEIYFFNNFLRQKTHLILGLLLGIWLLVFFNIHASGISVPALFDYTNQSEKNILFSAGFFSPALDLLTNCLPACLFLLLLAKNRNHWAWSGLVIFWLIFSLLAGWRYRIILLLLMVTGWGIRHWRWSFFRMAIACILLSVGIMWLTLNRMAIAKRQFSLVTWNLSSFDFGLLTHELSNSRTFHASLQYMNSNHVEKGGITTWIEHVVCKLQPKSSFPGGERPKPWILHTTKAWIPSGWPYNPNPAVSQMEEFYLTFGWPGLLIGMLIMGALVALFDFKTSSNGMQILQIMCIALCFQWISRGFFLYQFQISLAVLLPFAVLSAHHAYLRYAKSNQT